MKWIDDFRRLLDRLRKEEPSGAPDVESGISCGEAVERLFEWLDGELDPKARKEVGVHFEVCARCYPLVMFEKSFSEALARLSPGEGLPRELEDRILSSLGEEGFTER